MTTVVIGVPLPDPLSREGASIPTGHRPLRVDTKCRVHPGIQEVLPAAVPVAPSPPSFLRNLQKAGADSLASVPPAEPGAVAMQMTLSLACQGLLGNYFINISAVSSVTFLPHLLAVITERNALKHSLVETNQNASQPQPRLVMSGRTEKSSQKDMARNERRNIQLTSALASALPSVLPSRDAAF